MAIDYPDRPLNRLSTALRLFAAIPILVVLCSISGETFGSAGNNGGSGFAAAGGLLVLGPLVMLVFRGRYPGWWFAWNLEFARFSTRVGAYLALMDDRYPSTEDEQSVHLDIADPGRTPRLSRWLPLVKWLLAIPHYIVLFFLWIGAVVAVIAAWFAILVTGRYPRGLFTYVEGVIRWQLRVVAYAAILTTDAYPPFRLAP
ncbi:DUF4389 domain-containing protein [Baekduia soli]|uniref:DUF4389 domain-containing protein n=1 Tax=Baekduia soli TaxID=496014 RepID=A0A5B8UCV0_9ACTN|nr:DUF4389 domain-containing protein [Baekduia soli]